MNSYLPPSLQRNNFSSIASEAVLGALFGALGGLILIALLLVAYALFYVDFEAAKNWVAYIFKGFLVSLFNDFPLLGKSLQHSISAQSALETWLQFSRPTWLYYTTQVLFFAVTVGLALKMGLKRYRSCDDAGVGAGEMHISGLKFVEKPEIGLKVLSKNCALACKSSNAGVCIHPNSGKPIRITERAESSHFFFVGKSGSGKTQSLQHILRSVVERNDKIMIYDFKSDDFSAWFSDRYGRDAVLLAPWDTRTGIWDIAKDIEYLTDTNLLAKSLLPSDGGGGDEYWSIASRDILTAVLKYLRKEFGTEWGFSHLAVLFSDLDLLRNAVLSVDPGCADAHLGGEGDEQTSQTQGVQGTLRKCGEWMTQVAALWPHTPKTRARRFSIREYVHGTGRGKNQKIIVLGGNERFTFFAPVLASISSMYIGFKTAAPAGTGGRQWLFLDELGTLPKLENLVIGMTNARSKGLRFVLGIQDLGVLKNLYGDNLTDTIVNNPGTVVAGAATDPTTQEFFSKIFGTKIIERNQATLQPSNNGSGSNGLLGSNLPASYSWQKEETAVVHAGVIASLQPLHLLIKTPDMPAHVTLIRWQYQSLPNTGKPILERKSKLQELSWATPIQVLDKEIAAYAKEEASIVDAATEAAGVEHIKQASDLVLSNAATSDVKTHHAAPKKRKKQQKQR